MSAPKPSIAATRPVNPPGASPILTVDQLWKGLVIKAREPHRFLELFESSEIIKEEGTLVSLLSSSWRLQGRPCMCRSRNILITVLYVIDFSSCENKDWGGHRRGRSSLRANHRALTPIATHIRPRSVHGSNLRFFQVFLCPPHLPLFIPFAILYRRSVTSNPEPSASPTSSPTTPLASFISPSLGAMASLARTPKRPSRTLSQLRTGLERKLSIIRLRL